MCVFRKSFTGSGWAYALIQNYNFIDMFFWTFGGSQAASRKTWSYKLYNEKLWEIQTDMLFLFEAWTPTTTEYG